MAFLQVECVVEHQGGKNELAEKKESLCGCSLSAVVEVRDWIPRHFSKDESEQKIRVLLQAILIISLEMEKIFSECFPKRTMWNYVGNCSPILASYFCEIPEVKDVSKKRLKTSVRKLCIRCMSTMADFQVIRFEESRHRQETLEMQNSYSEPGQAGSFTHDEEFAIQASRGRKNVYDRLKNVSMSKSQSFIEESQRSSTSVLGKVCNIFGIEPLQKLHLGMPKLLKEYRFKYHGSDKVMTNFRNF